MKGSFYMHACSKNSYRAILPPDRDLRSVGHLGGGAAAGQILTLCRKIFDICPGACATYATTIALARHLSPICAHTPFAEKF